MVAGVASAPFAELCPVAPDGERGAFAVDGLTPGVVACPEKVEQVSAVVRLAAERRLGVAPWGGGTQMRLGNLPRSLDVALCTTALDKVLEYEPADLVVTVQAGIRLGELQRRLAEHGQQLALDPPLAEQATIGGVIAANSSGPLRLRHGTVRDMLLGVTVVNADGAITKGGGKVVKNVTGYDMCKLYTGSLGTLGVVVEASFKLAPLPAQERTVQAWFGDPAAAWAAARAIYRAALPVRACGLLSPSAAACFCHSEESARPGRMLRGAQHDKGGSVEAAGWLLLVRIGGGETAVERQVRDVLALCAAAERSEALDGAQFWPAIRDFGREQESIGKLSSQPSRTGELLAALPDGAATVSHVLSGVTYVYGAEAEAACETARGLGGYGVLEACPIEVKRRLDVWGPVGPDFALMDRIKREFDPDGILNPGRYVGRL